MELVCCSEEGSGLTLLSRTRDRRGLITLVSRSCNRPEKDSLSRLTQVQHAAHVLASVR